MGGLLGSANAAKEHALAMKKLTADFAAASAAFRGDDIAKALADNAASAEALYQMVKQLYTGQARQDQYALITAQTQRNADTIQKTVRRTAAVREESLVVRNMRALGQGRR